MMSSSKEKMDQRRNKGSDRCLRNSSCNCVMLLVMSIETMNSKMKSISNLVKHSRFPVHLTRNRKEITQFTKPFFFIYFSVLRFCDIVFTSHKVQHTAVGPCLSYEYPRKNNNNNNKITIIIISFETALLTCLIKYSGLAS